MKNNQYLIPFSVLAFGLIICSIIVSTTWRYNAKLNQTITVTGSAKKDIVSDLGFLRGTISAQAGSAGAAFQELNSRKPILLEYLASKGFPKDKINFFTITNYPIYEVASNGIQTQNVLGYVYSQRIEISSTEVQKIKEISLDVSSIINKGVSFMVEMPEYYYTKLSDLKIEVQAEAAKDAMKRGERIAASTDRSLGPLRNARMGVLQITPKFSNVISDYGVNDLSSIEKEITAVVSASFEID
ncbi:MAG: SIMPL domain-containing protein [Ignavibacteriales bacterium]|nr:SIMPL domain-containing protein [Ignavibacteriales bacterium]